jgi:hypothetical protein
MHGGPLFGIQGSERYGGFIRYFGHFPAQRVKLLYELPFSHAADRRATWHRS